MTKKEDLLSHTLLPIYEYFITLFPQTKIKFIKDIEGGRLEKNIRELQSGQILFIENTRFADITDMSGEINNKAMRESENSEQLARY